MLSLFLSLPVLVGGCDGQSFQPIKQNDAYYFSIYGYIDASADTQWIRIAPAREQLTVPRQIPEMRVTLTEIETGQQLVMKDSLFQLPNGVRYLNFWTTGDIKPDHTYQLKAERPDGATSTARVTIPADYPSPQLEYTGGGCRANLDIDGVHRLADVQSIWHIYIKGPGWEDERFIRIPYRVEAVQMDSTRFSVFLNAAEELKNIAPATGQIQVLRREIFVASGGPGWLNKIGTMEDLEYALPEGMSNVNNGVGYVVGIVSKTIPYTECY